MPVREFLDRWFASHPTERIEAAVTIANERLDAEFRKLWDAFLEYQRFTHRLAGKIEGPVR